MLHAFALWEARLDSRVPIEIAFEFTDLGCLNGATILGGASPASAFTGVDPANSDLYYVSALANSLAGRDLDPGEPDINAQFNSSVDRECRTATGGGFYYGFDGNAQGAVDFVHVVLHELGHGLGLTSLVNVETGALLMNAGDSYTANIRDLSLDTPWLTLSNAQRKASASHVRGVVWDGEQAARLVPGLFAAGDPALTLEPAVSGFSGAVADVAFAHNSALHPITGELLAAESCSPRRVAPGTILLFSERCPARLASEAAADSGAAGALVVSTWPFSAPPMPIDREAGDDSELELPVLSIGPADATSLQRALAQKTLRATLAGDAKGRIGADAKQRPFLFASQPVSKGSTISHLEESVRPSQLMEPYATDEATHDLTFTVALLRDIGWPLVCGNGRLDPGEECDEADKNSDAVADACRSDCRLPHCGDGVRDRGEGCDSATGNDDRAVNGCRTSCQPAACGDGVIDRGEQCDRGRNNSDSRADACRPDCQLPHCGDGVTDALEQCDDGNDNSDSRADACRTDCRLPSCGDGVVDDAEKCDEGRRNSASQADACRPSCVAASCGDGVVDEGEACDGTSGCGADCRAAVPSRSYTTGGSAEMRSDHADAGDSMHQERARMDGAAEGGCGCRVSQSPLAPARTSALVWMSVVCGFGVWRRRRYARRLV
jgi:MYXO-CTERM domain-containing protein